LRDVQQWYNERWKKLMSTYTEAANGTFPYITSRAYGIFANVLQPDKQEIRPFQTVRSSALCHLQVLVQPPLRRAVFIATEINENPGQSITNAAEALATQLVAAFDIEPEQLRFIEHYTLESDDGSDDISYDEVTFDWQGRQARNPQRRRLQPSEITELTVIE